MGLARRLAVLLTWSVLAAVPGRADAQEADAAPPTDEAASAEDDAKPQGYEPDQRGAVDEDLDALMSPEASPPPAGDEAYYAPELTELDSEAPMATDAWEAGHGFYLRAQTGYTLLDVTALDAGDVAGGDEVGALHGGMLGLGAGLHVRPLDLGLRLDLGLHDDGALRTTLLADVALWLGRDGLVPWLRVGAGYGWLTDLDLGAAAAETSVGGPVLELGAGVHSLVTDDLSLGGGLDLGLWWLTRDGDAAAGLPDGSSTGLYLRLYLDLGWEL